MSTFTHHPRIDVDTWTFDPTRTYQQQPDMKPHGFWLSVDDDWARWITEEDMTWLDGVPTVEFDVDTEACLWLKTVEDLDRFHATWVNGQDQYRIDWTPLTLDFAGLIIAPYQWERRLSDLRWYYSWDCASACIWNLSVLTVNESAVSA